MSDHFDDQIRHALKAEAEGVTADGRLLERTMAATTGSGRSWVSRAAPWLVVAAAIAAFAGVAGVLVDRDDEQTVDVADDPDGPDGGATLGIDDIAPSPQEQCTTHDGTVLLVVMSGTAADEDIAQVETTLDRARTDGAPDIDSARYVDEADVLEQIRQQATGPEPDSAAEGIPTYFVVTMPAGSDDVDLRGDLADLPGVSGLSSTDCSGASPSTTEVPADVPAPPEQLVAVTERGRLVVVDTATGGVVRDLGGFEDPTDPAVANREGGAFAITGVALHPNGREVYFETCCEPAAGAIFKVPIDGSVPIDSSRLAPVAYGYGIDISADGRWLAYVDGSAVNVMELETGDVPFTEESGDASWVQAAINADGTELAVERVLERDPESQVVRSDARLISVVDGGYEEISSVDGRFIPIWIEGGQTLASAPAPGTMPLDANVDASGAWILEVTDDGRLVGRSEDMVEIPGGAYTAADW